MPPASFTFAVIVTALIASSTYALIDCWVASWVSLSEARSSSSRIAVPETPVGGSVTVVGSLGTEAKTVVIRVADTGGGMPPDIRDRLFTKGAISGKPGGTGLGTRIVKDVVVAHGGTITVDSEQGKGTTFTMELPIHGQPG